MSNSIIQSLDRGLQILIILGKSGAPLSLNDIAAHFDIDRSSVFRLITTLIKNGFVVQDPDNKKYSIGFRVLELAGSFESLTRVDSIIRPVLHCLCGETRQNTHLGILDGNEVVFIAVEQPRDSVSMNLAVGTREPAAPTALGKAIIAFLRPELKKSFLESITLSRYTEKSIMEKKAYLEIIEEVNRGRIAFDDEEYKPGIVCMAAPILNGRKEALFSLGISGPRDMIVPRRDELAELVRKAGIEASVLLGGPPENGKD